MARPSKPRATPCASPMFHWGVHAWAIYAVVAISLAYLPTGTTLPLTIRSALYPLIGERIYGPIGHAVDIFAVVGTLFGVATSLGFGVIQVNSGLHYLFAVPTSVGRPNHPDCRDHLHRHAVRGARPGQRYPAHLGTQYRTRRACCWCSCWSPARRCSCCRRWCRTPACICPICSA